MLAFGLLERYFFKVRNVIEYNRGHESNDPSVEVIEMRGLPAGLSSSVDDLVLRRYVDNRIGSCSWTLFLYWERDVLAGYSFLHTPSHEEWNDSLPTFPKEARISSQFVYPEFRGKGIIGRLFLAQKIHAEQTSKTLWSVIENSNYASMKAASKVGFVKRKNYLIKFFGRNIISVLTSPLEVYVLYGCRRARR